MVKRVILGRSGEERVVDLIKQINESATQGSTRPAGDKVLEDYEDFYWGRNDGTSTSMREVDEGLALAEVRIEDAVADLNETQVRLDDAEVLVGEVQGDLDRVETEVIPGAVAELEQADAAAQQVLGELDTRLTSIDAVGTGELATIRDALTAAQDAVDAAQSVATEANKAANAASQAALEAAGIAASKGRVIVSETEPVGEDRKSSNIWIKPIPDDPETEVEEKSVTYVYIEASNEWQPTTSSELAQAAQNALDAREAAQQAQQRADTAIANAEKAQGAAEAAQRTADQATTDAREAHNEAVAAQERVEAKIASGDSLVLNGSFESGDLGWPENGDHGGRSRIIESDDAHSGSHVLELAPDTANVYPESDHIAVEPGRVLHIRGWFKHLGGDGTRVGLLYRTHDKDKAYIGIGYAETRDPQAEVVGEWFMLSGDYEVPEGVQSMRFAFHASGASTSVYHADALQVLDVTEARAAQARADEAYAEAAKKLDESQVDAKITASANGKNSITRSLQDPFEAGVDGVVRGDQWYQVDGHGNAFASWYWGGTSWVASLVKNEMMESLDVHKLQVTGEAAIEEAVIDKLWVDGIAARSVTAGSLTVSPGNMLSWHPRPDGSEDISPHNKYSSGAEYIRWDYDADMGGKVLTVNMASGGSTDTRFFMQLHPDVPATDLVTEFGGNPFPVRGGSSYRLEFGLGRGGNYPDGSPAVRASFYVYDHAGTRISIISAGDLKRPNGSTDPLYTKPERHGATVTLPEEAAFVNIFLSASASGFIYMFEPELRPLTGAVLIEDGAITTPKLTVTEDMSAAIVNAMTVNTKKLVVSEEAILNHATLIGQTVVDDINVQGKLIGTDGVFTGTVDFANVNVTGDVLADRISGEHLYGTVVEGGEIVTTDTGAGQVMLSDNGYVDPANQKTWPGIRVIPGDMSDLVSPPGLGPNNNGMIITGGRNTGGGRGFTIYAPHSAEMRYVRGAAASNVVVRGDLAYVDADDGLGNEGEIKATSTYARVRTDAADGSYGTVEAGRDYAVAATREPGGDYMSQIRAVGREAYMHSAKPGGGYRYLTVGYDGAWVQEDGWEDIDLTAPFRSKWVAMSYPSAYEHPHGAPLSYCKIGKRVWWRGRFQKKDGSKFRAGTQETIINLNASWRPSYTTGTIAAIQGSRTCRVEVSASGGIWVRPQESDSDWVTLDGLWYDLP